MIQIILITLLATNFTCFGAQPADVVELAVHVLPEQPLVARAAAAPQAQIRNNLRRTCIKKTSLLVLALGALGIYAAAYGPTPPINHTSCGIPSDYNMTNECIDAYLTNNVSCQCTSYFKLCPINFVYDSGWIVRGTEPALANITNGCELQKYLTAETAPYIKQVILKPSTDGCDPSRHIHWCTPITNLQGSIDYQNRVDNLRDLCESTKELYCIEKSEQPLSSNAQRLAYGKAHAKNFTAQQQQHKRARKTFTKKGR